jgi:hypothetical protein
VVAGTHTHWWFALQALPTGQNPQLSVPPQPSGTPPHSRPGAQVTAGAHTQAVPLLLQAWPEGHVPQATLPPQPSGAVPQI